jgi:hypothetical protein
MGMEVVGEEDGDLVLGSALSVREDAQGQKGHHNEGDGQEAFQNIHGVSFPNGFS